MKKKAINLKMGEDMGDVQGRVAGRGWREGREGESEVILFQLKIKTLGFIIAMEAIQDFSLLEG